MNELALRMDNLDRLLKRVDSKYRYPARAFVGYLRTTGQDLGDPAAWQGYLASLTKAQTIRGRKRRYSASSYNVRLQAMKAVVREALDGSTLNLSAAEMTVVQKSLDDLKGKKKPAPSSYIPEKVMKAEEVQQLIEAAKLPGWGLPHRSGAQRRPRIDVALWLSFLWETGCRVSEMCDVLLTDIERTNGHYTVRLKCKGNKERLVSVTVDLVNRIREHFHSDTYLFQSPNRGKGAEEDYRFSRTYVSQEIARVGWTVLHKRISAHALRHSAGTHYYQRTRDIYATQAFLGHASVATTAAYYVHSQNDPVQTLDIMSLPVAHNSGFGADEKRTA